MLSNLNKIIEKHNSVEMQFLIQRVGSIYSEENQQSHNVLSLSSLANSGSWGGSSDQKRRTQIIQDAFKEAGYSNISIRSYELMNTEQ